MLYPEVQVLLFFVIPVRVKYFGVFAGILWVLSFLGAPLPQKLSLLLSMANVWLFFGQNAGQQIDRIAEIAPLPFQCRADEPGKVDAVSSGSGKTEDKVFSGDSPRGSLTPSVKT